MRKPHGTVRFRPDRHWYAMSHGPSLSLWCVLCDFEVKRANVVGFITNQLRHRYPGAEIYFAVFGAMTKDPRLEVADFDDLTGVGIMRAADFAAVFIAATMSLPGIEPPLELR
ncbi:hypothetical protein [Microtetraspora malaysiensis]|uniref:Uncharacterized protein n=1 Tax=Microtetraspora malaysiensis TaxID=161358 RepID=A0ABW6T4V1_9ACTN